MLSAGARARFVEADIASFARLCFEQAAIWVAQARKATASATYSFRFLFPNPLPHYREPFRTNSQLRAMRATLDLGYTRVASDFHLVPADDPHLERLKVRLAEIEAERSYTEQVWQRNPPAELRGWLGDRLTLALDDVYALGQALARPALLS